MKTRTIAPRRPLRKPSVPPATLFLPGLSHRLLRRGAASILTTTLLVATPPLTYANQLLVDGVTETLSTPASYDGEGFPSNAPNEAYEEGDPNASAAHRNAVMILNGGILNLVNGADLSVKNDNDNTTFLRVGYGSAQTGTLNIGTGAQLSVGQASRYANFHVGDGAGTTGDVNQTGGQVTVRGSLNLGVDGGTGTYTISNGTLTLDHADDAGHTSLITLGLNLNAAGEDAGTSTGTLVINGGRVEVAAPRPVGEETGSIGFILGNRDRGAATYGDGNGVVEQNAGTFSVGTGASLYLSSVGNGTYHLNGGTLEIGGNSLRAKYGNGPGTYEFRLGGGTVQVTGSDLNTSVNATLATGTVSTLDTNGLDATWSGDFTGIAALIKKGEGKATLNGTNDFAALSVEGGEATNGTGTTTVAFLGVGANGATGSYEISAGTVNVIDNDNDADLTVGGGAGGDGRLDISNGTLNVGREGSFGRFFVGAYDGEGEVYQSGGTVNTTGPFNIGNRGGTGTYHLSGGLLNVGQYPASNDSNALILGRSRTGQQTGNSEGRINVSDTGRLVLNTNTPLLIGGDSDSVALMSSGYVTQTGGSVEVDSWIDLGSNGYGQYDLNGGRLEIGGADGLRSSSGNYQFNLGGGTLKVRGSSLTTDVEATLVNGTLSTIDTNGLNATLSNGFTGTGGFRKIGPGTLILGASTTLAADSSSQGGLSINGPAGSPASLTVSPGVTVNIDSIAGGNSFLAMGDGTGTEGELHLNEATIALNLTEPLHTSIYVGKDGTGTLNMTDSHITQSRPDGPITGAYSRMFIGTGEGAVGVLHQDGGSVDLAHGSFNLGIWKGHGTYTLSGDAVHHTGQTVYIGHDVGGWGLLEVTEEATFNMLTGDVGMTVGLSGATGTIRQSGSESLVNIDNGAGAQFGSGANGTGVYELINGTLIMDAKKGAHFGETLDSTGEFTQSGGNSTFRSQPVHVGHGGKGTFTLSNGTSTLEKGIVLGHLASSDGTLNLNGGVLRVGGTDGIRQGAGSAAFNLGGGTLQVLTSDLTSSLNITLVEDKTSTIDTNGLKASFSGELSGEGHLRKTGDGTLLLSGENSYTGTTEITAGTLSIDAGGTTGSGAVTIGVDAILSGTGLVRGATTVQGRLNPGNSPGTLTFEGDLTLDSSAITTFELNGDQNDLVKVFQDLQYGGILSIVLDAGYSPELNSTFTLFEGFENQLGTFDEIVFNRAGYEGTFNYVSGELNIAAVPEPGTYVFVFGTAAAAWLLRRRNRLKTAA